MAGTVISTAAKAPPLFLTRNYLDRDSVVYVRSGDAFKERAFDFVPSSKYYSVGSNDGIQEQYDFQIFRGSTADTPELDFFAVLGHNLLTANLYYSTNGGASWVNTGMTFGAGTAPIYTLRSLGVSSVSPNRVALFMDTTQTANAEKYFATLVAAKVILQPSRGFREYRREYDDNVRSVVLAGGDVDTTHVYRDGQSSEHARFFVSFAGVSESERQSFLSLKRLNSNFLFMPEPGDVPGDVYNVRMEPGSYRESYLSRWKGAGWAIEFELRELGGA